MIVHTHRSSDPSPFRRLVVFGIVSTLAALVFALVVFRKVADGGGESTALAQPPASPESFGSVQPFSLTERDGRTVTRETLAGRPWVADFVFTRCAGPCPKVSGNMRKLQDRLAGVDARLVTFSVDPEYDTPEVLAKYADALGADRERWLFLTGTPAAIEEVSRKSFLLPVQVDPSQPAGSRVTHRTVLTVVDQHGAVRGYYDGESEAGVESAAARVRWLAAQP